MLRLCILILVACAPVSAGEDEAQTVYDRIVQASGVSGRPPRLVVYPQPPAGQRIAWYDAEHKTVGIEQKTLRLCAAMKESDSCLAVFLGHELAHFYKDHKWGGDFGSRFGGTDLGVKVRALSAATVLLYETQADDAGGMYGYLAGYNTLSIAGNVIESAYREWGLIGHEPSGYPSLAERKSIAQKSITRLESLIPLWESGTLLLALGHYEESGRCFDAVADVLPGGAMLNNAGIAYAMEGDRLDGSSPRAWFFDSVSRLEARPTASSRGGSTETPEHRKQRLLAAAEARLTEALRRDHEYQPASQNLALLHQANGGGSGAAAPPVYDGVRTEEKIAGVPPDQVPDKLPSTATLDPDTPGQPRITVSARRFSGYWEILVRCPDWSARALVTQTGYTGETEKHLRIGAPLADALKAYGAPTLKLGAFTLFEDFSIAFEGSTKVERWIVFLAE